MSDQQAMAVAEKLPIERAHFRALIAANPNHFGTIKGSSQPSVVAKSGDVAYEELKCVGYNPDLDLLKAVVWIKQSAGYLGGLCSLGSQEYVRFYLSFDNGATWLDQGLASFTAYDIATAKPLEYAVTLQPRHYQTWCFREELPLVRAILSWNNPPPANMPDFVPVWGNVLNEHIQIKPRRLFVMADLLAEAKVTLPAEMSAMLDPAQEIAAPQPQQLTTADLAALYHGKDVHQHRYLFPLLHADANNPAVAEAYAAYGSAGPFANLGVDIGALLAALAKTDGDTSYERLGCVGLDPNGSDNLVGILTVRRPNGYGGTQCQQGSQEYVAFWVDWEDGSGWHWVGTAQVAVHDFHTIPSDGLQYAVGQPINLAAYRKPCQQGPVTARVRAILSWAVAPPAWNPDYHPVWGNRVETRIHVYPGKPASTGDYTPYIESICSIDICDIDPATGLAPGDRPFGAGVAIYGIIPGSPSVTTPAANRPKYRVSVKALPGGSWQALNDPFNITIHEQILPGPPTATPFTQTTDVNNFYTYQVAPNVPGVGWRDIVPSGLLAVWNTSGKTGLWQIMIEAFDPVANIHWPAGGTFCVKDGTTRSTVVIDLDNEAPITSLDITGFSRDGGPVQPAQDCASFEVGDVIYGTYSVFDEHFGSFDLVVEPQAHAHGAHPAKVNPSPPPATLPLPRSYPAVPNTGESGGWTLDTQGMDPCGYTIQLQSNDRTIVSCVTTWRNDSAFVGFCLIAKPA